MRQPAQNNVAKLVQAGILQQVGEASYGKAFLAVDILRAIGEGEPRIN